MRFSSVEKRGWRAERACIVCLGQSSGIQDAVYGLWTGSGSELLRLQLLSEDFRPAHIAVGNVLQIVDFGL